MGNTFLQVFLFPVGNIFLQVFLLPVCNTFLRVFLLPVGNTFLQVFLLPVGNTFLQVFLLRVGNTFLHVFLLPMGNTFLQVFLLPMGISCYFCCFDRQVNQTSKTVDEVHNHKGVLKQRINKESSSCKTRWSIKLRRKNLVPFTTEITCYLQLRAVNFKYSYIWSMLVYS